MTPFLKLETLGEAIATRAFTLRDGNAEKEVVLRIGRPQQMPDHSDFFCPWELQGIGETKIRYACGVDQMQALLLAISTISVYLETLDPDIRKRLRWLDMDDLGLPRSDL